ncbi:hypothetical protein SEPCBS119000_003012 [Sporothrix epigloea]|uniref:Uncharacterized protein n=1 Tax=Sporothrix epigloea TaxID=1892477 RepID=A0ABP0DJ98_9PEZI
MGGSLRQISDGAIHALAVVLSLPPDRLERIGTHHRAKPAAGWLTEQGIRIPGLPRCLQAPSMPNISVKVAQVAKRVRIAASGGADTLAAKAAVKGIHVDTVLHPSSTPTILCAAHRDLHPTVVREMFYYLSRELADHADIIRRHPLGVGTSHEDNCSRQSRQVHEWGLRMIGMSALWCTPHIFRALESGRQASVPGNHLSQTHKKSSNTSSKQPAASSSSTATPVSAPHIRSNMRLPHLEFPCEACVLAIVGARSQSLIDLRASMLSRMALDAHEQARRSKRRAEPAVRLGEADRRPNLLPLIDAYIEVLGDEYGEEIAHEIRQRSVVLAQALFQARACENRRQRHQACKLRRLRKAGMPTKHLTDKKPPRMVTDRGHRLPLPLVPLDNNFCAQRSESAKGADPSLNEELLDGELVNNNDSSNDDNKKVNNKNDTNYKDNDNGYGNRDLYFVVQDSHDSLPLNDKPDDKMEQLGEPTKDLDCDAHAANSRNDASVVEEYSKPFWEDEYFRNILDSQAVVSPVYSRPPARCENRDDEAMSYATISVHTEVPMSIGTPVAPARLSTQGALPNTLGTAAPPRGSCAATKSDLKPSAASSHNSRSDKTVQPVRNVRPHGTAQHTASHSPAPASSIYSQPESAKSSRLRVDPATQKTTSSRTRAPAAPISATFRPAVARSTAQPVSRSPCPPAGSSKPPSTLFVAPLKIRTPATTESHLQQQGALVASSPSGIHGSSDSSRASSAVLSPVTQSTTNTSVSYHSPKLQAKAQTKAPAQSKILSKASSTTRETKLTGTKSALGEKSLSRDLAPSKTKFHKAPITSQSVSRAQPTAVSTIQSPHAGRSQTSKGGASTSASPLTKLPRTAMRLPTRPSASPATTPSNSAAQKNTPMAPTLTPQTLDRAKPTRHHSSKAPLLSPLPTAIPSSNAKAAQWLGSAPSTFSWSRPSSSLAPSFEEIQAAKFYDSDCLVLPEDSISVVAVQRILDKADHKAHREKERKEKSKPAAPTRNLNHYQPAVGSGHPRAPTASSSSMRPQHRRQKEAPTPVPPPRAHSSRTPLASSRAKPSGRPIAYEARTSQTSRVTQWPSQPLI